MPSKTTKASRTGKTTPARGKVAVQSVVPCLGFAERAEEAVDFYVSIFKGAKVKDKVYSEGGPVPKGTLLHATFELGGQEYTALNGGPSFTFSQGFSMVATCKTQEELDEVWARLTAGGQESRCGWLTDRFGVSWQVVPASLGKMVSRPEKGNTEAMWEALLKMGKLDIKALERAYGS